MLKGNYDYADKIYFTECVLGDPANPVFCKTFLANLQKKYGTKKKAAGSLAGSLFAAGKAAAISRTPAAAFKAAIESIKANPWNVDALLSAGSACEDLGFAETSIEYYRAAAEADPNHIRANSVCAEALRHIADYDGALACVKQMLNKHPTDRELLRLYNDITAEKTMHRGKYTTGDSRQVRAAVTAEQTEDSDENEENKDITEHELTYEEQIERRIRKNPQDTANYSELAQWYYKKSDFAKAEEWYAKGAAVSNNAPEMTEHLLDAQQQRLHDEAFRLKEEYEKKPDEAAKSAFLAVREQYDAKKMELALYRVKQYPNHTGYRYQYGVLLQKAGQIKEAIAEFQLAKAEAGRAGDCLLALGQCFQLIKQYKLAIMHYHEAIQTLDNTENKKKALYLAVKLSILLEDYAKAEDYGQQLAAVDFSYRDISDLLDYVSSKK